MVTLAGGVARAGLELCTVTRAPPAGAGADRVTVPVTVVPPTTVLGLTRNEIRAGGVTVTAVLFTTPLELAERLPTVVVPTGVVLMAKLAALCVAGTTTLAGTLMALGALLNATLRPPAGAGVVRVTVPVALVPPVTVLGVALTDDSAGGPEGPGCQPSWMTSKSLAVNNANAGFKMSLFHRVSKVPVIYMSLPLSATMRP